MCLLSFRTRWHSSRKTRYVSGSSWNSRNHLAPFTPADRYTPTIRPRPSWRCWFMPEYAGSVAMRSTEVAGRERRNCRESSALTSYGGGVTGTACAISARRIGHRRDALGHLFGYPPAVEIRRHARLSACVLVEALAGLAPQLALGGAAGEVGGRLPALLAGLHVALGEDVLGDVEAHQVGEFEGAHRPVPAILDRKGAVLPRHLAPLSAP